MLSSTAKPYIDASVPVLRQHGLAITTVFYRNMLGANPELNNLFNLGNQANGSQQQSLAAAVFAYAANIENTVALGPVVERIVHKHVSIGIQPSHYPIVGKYLLGAIKEVLGEAATPDLLAAWDEAYWLLAGALIAAEARLYERNGNEDKQWLKMKVAKIDHVTEEITSYTLEAIASSTLAPFNPGQYISIAAFIEEIQLRQIRQYSLSDAQNGKNYRITTKREKGDDFKPKGTFSNWIHQHLRIGSLLDVSHPYGTFVPDLSKQNPITLISTGVGITPMISILNTLAKQGSDRHILFAHAARSQHHLAHYNEVNLAGGQLKNLTTAIYLNEKAPKHFLQGRLELAEIIEPIHLSGDFYICGPTPFMNDQWKALVELGVSPNNIHREVFGPESLDQLI